MAVFSFLVSSLFGLVSGLVCWMFFGYSFLAALGLYLSLSMVLGMGIIITGMMAQPSDCAKANA